MAASSTAAAFPMARAAAAPYACHPPSLADAAGARAIVERTQQLEKLGLDTKARLRDAAARGQFAIFVLQLDQQLEKCYVRTRDRETSWESAEVQQGPRPE